MRSFHSVGDLRHLSNFSSLKIILNIILEALKKPQMSKISLEKINSGTISRSENTTKCPEEPTLWVFGIKGYQKRGEMHEEL